MSLVTVGGYYYVVIDLRFSALKAEPHLAVVVVADGLNCSIEEYVVWRKSFHYSINIALGAVFESKPVWSGGDGVEKVMIPPVDSQYVSLL